MGAEFAGSAVAELVGGAGKACRYGCLGYGNCARISALLCRTPKGNSPVIMAGICLLKRNALLPSLLKHRRWGYV